MDTWGNQRVSPNRVALIGALLVVAWLVLLFFPRKGKPTLPVAPVVTESKLRAVGLADNPDWEGMPELFAVWADGLTWTDNKTRFGYWNPGSHSYSYFFEATRRKGSYHFRAVPKQEFSKEVYYVNEDENEITEEVPEFRSTSPAHPFVFVYPIAFGPGSHKDELRFKSPRLPHEKHAVEVDIKSVPLIPPAPVIKKP